MDSFCMLSTLLQIMHFNKGITEYFIVNSAFGYVCDESIANKAFRYKSYTPPPVVHSEQFVHSVTEIALWISRALHFQKVVYFIF
jgi:hypothetical protein